MTNMLRLAACNARPKLRGLGNVPILDGGTLLMIQRQHVGAMIEATMPFQAGSAIMWQERQQWGDNPQWYSVSYPIPAQYLGPTYLGPVNTAAPSPTVPDGIVRTDPVSKTVPTTSPVPVTQVPKTPTAPLPVMPGGAPDDLVGGVYGGGMAYDPVAPAAATPIPWGLLVMAGLALAGA